MGKSFNTAQRHDGVERKLHSVAGKTRGRIPLQTVALTDPDDSYDDIEAYLETTHSEPHHGYPDDYPYED